MMLINTMTKAENVNLEINMKILKTSSTYVTKQGI